jgi:hypothetical protein
MRAATETGRGKIRGAGAGNEITKSHPRVAFDFIFGRFFRFTVATAITLVRAKCSAVEQLFSF